MKYSFSLGCRIIYATHCLRFGFLFMLSVFCNLLSLSLVVGLLQVMLLGDSAVGKTCVLVRFKDGAFLGGNFIATVGIDFRVRVTPFNSPDRLVILFIISVRPIKGLSFVLFSCYSYEEILKCETQPNDIDKATRAPLVTVTSGQLSRYFHTEHFIILRW